MPIRHQSRTAPQASVREPRASTTDAEARVMKMADGGFRPAFHVQFAADTKIGAVAGVSVDNAGSDMGKMAPMSDALAAAYSTRPGKRLADGGYAKLADIDRLTEASVTAFVPVPKPRDPARDKGLLKRACAIGRQRADLKDATLKAYEADLERRLDRLLALDPVHPTGFKLRRMIRKVRSHLFVFVQNRELEPTNNGSERALRPCAVYRKITNGFRQEWGAHFYADIRSTIATARPHGDAPSMPSASPSTVNRFT